jgi:invasin-like protein
VRAARPAACALLAVVAVGAAGAGPAAASMSLGTEFNLSSYQAGGHPDAEISFDVASASGETLKSVVYVPNAGFTFEPASLPSCANTTFEIGECGPGTQLGVVTVRGAHEGNSNYLFGTAPVYNLTPLSNQFARIGFLIPTIEEPVVAIGSLVPEPPWPALDPYQLRLSLDELPEASPLSSVRMSIWGVPAGSAHDADRFPQGSTGCPGSETTGCNTPTSSGLGEAPFTLDAVYCAPGQSFLNWVPSDSYSTYEGFKNENSAMLLRQGGCEALTFDPALSAAPTTSAGHSAGGLDVVVSDPQPQSPGTVSPSELQTASVTVRGVTLDPSLSEHPVCEDSAAAITGNQPSACPPSSKIGTAALDVKGLAEKVQGQIFLGRTEGEKLRVFVVGKAGGLELKLLGLIDRLVPNGLKLTLGAQPRLPIAEEALHFLPSFVRTPVHCGDYAVEGKLVPWAPSLPTDEPKSSYSVSTGPGGSPCIGKPETVAVQLQPTSIAADGSSKTTVTVTVQDAEGIGVPAEEVRLSSTDPSQKFGEVVDVGDGTYSATVTGSTTIGKSTITATDASASPQISGSADLAQTGGSPPPPTPSGEATPPPTPRVPVIRWLRKPPRHEEKRRARFDFAADVPGATFTCSLDHHRYSPCTPPVVLRNLTVGRHVFSVRAVNGPVLGPPASWSFRVIHLGRHSRAGRVANRSAML